jgi:hypothetical protein
MSIESTRLHNLAVHCANIFIGGQSRRPERVAHQPLFLHDISCSSEGGTTAGELPFHLCGRSLIDARHQTGTAPDETRNCGKTRESELVDRRLQVPPSPAARPSPYNSHVYARGEAGQLHAWCLTKDIRDEWLCAISADHCLTRGFRAHALQYSDRAVTCEHSIGPETMRATSTARIPVEVSDGGLFFWQPGHEVAAVNRLLNEFFLGC